MSALSTYLQNQFLSASLRNVDYQGAATVYLALFTTATDAGSGGTEVSATGTAYVRQSIAFSAPVGGVTSNSATVTFPTATASWGTVTHFAVYDGTGGGANRLYYGAIGIAKTVDQGDLFTVPSAALSIQLT